MKKLLRGAAADGSKKPKKKPDKEEKADASCTAEDLERIIQFYDPQMTLSNDGYDEVYTNIFIGDGEAAKNLGLLRRLGITHVVNCCQGTEPMHHVNTSADTYRNMGAKFLGIPAYDIMTFNLRPFFEEVAEFIDAALKGGGKVFVHCIMGVSRSATLTVAYLMLKKHIPARDAIRMVKTRRDINPNLGFLEQLAKYNEELKHAGHFAQTRMS